MPIPRIIASNHVQYVVNQYTVHSPSRYSGARSSALPLTGPGVVLVRGRANVRC
jgi:hypothetical protein